MNTRGLKESRKKDETKALIEKMSKVPASGGVRKWWICTEGAFKRTNKMMRVFLGYDPIPEGFTLIEPKDSTSKYLESETEVYRHSDHWVGLNFCDRIASCKWSLKNGKETIRCQVGVINKKKFKRRVSRAQDYHLICGDPIEARAYLLETLKRDDCDTQMIFSMLSQTMSKIIQKKICIDEIGAKTLIKRMYEVAK